jgi:hypothetical protein
MSAEQTRFDWEASESAPQHFPMQIVFGDLLYHDTPSGAGLYVPDNVLIYHGWGRSDSSHVTGDALKPLPDRLDISFYSYQEDQFYQGSFELPYEKILRLFQEAEAGPKRRAMNGDEIPNSYVVTTGVAPGGTVAVWFAFHLGQTELFFGKAEKTEMDYAKAFRKPFTFTDEQDRKRYVEKIIHDVVSPEKLADIRKNGIPFDKWSNYRLRYNWSPMFAVSQPPDNKISISFYSGEGRSFPYPPDKSYTDSTHPIPRAVRFSYAIKGVDLYYVVDFDEDEMFDAFTRLSAKQLPMQLEIDPRYPKEQTLIRLHNGKESIQLRKFRFGKQ